jgi:hypothetical protein
MLVRMGIGKKKIARSVMMLRGGEVDGDDIRARGGGRYG